MSLIAILRPALPHSRRGWLALGAIILATLIAFLPLRLALGLAGDSGLSARSAGGTIWSGRLIDARLGPLGIGSIDTRLRPLSLLLARLRFDAARIGGAPLAGSGEIGWGRRAVHDLTGSIEGGRLGELAVGQIMFEQVTIIFSGGRCAAASGRVRLVPGSGFALADAATSLSATPRCDGEALLLPLVSDSGGERLMLRISGDGRYTGVLGSSGGAVPTLRIEGRF